MIKTVKKLFVPVVVVLALGFILFLVNQISGVFLLLSQYNQVAANVVLVLLIALFGTLILTPFLVYFGLPKPIAYPKNELEVPTYRKKLLTRLKGNPVLLRDNSAPVKEEDLESAIEVLNKKADETIGETASVVFLTTSISQNGKLDAFTVFITQVRMVWKVAHIYYQRPSLRELMYLYSNVGASSFLASEIEDMDLTRQIEPILNALFKNASGRSVPFLGNATQVILDSIMEGSTNAFLTLRVGILTKKYCGELGVADPARMRKEAIREAANQLRVITMKSSARLMSSLVTATKNASWDKVKTGWEGMKNTGVKVKNTIVETSEKVNPFRSRVREEDTSD